MERFGGTLRVQKRGQKFLGNIYHGKVGGCSSMEKQVHKYKKLALLSLV